MDASDMSMNDAATMRPGGEAFLGRIDQYELVRELGGGGFGTVYLARDAVSGVEVAVKGLPPMVKNNREELANIRSNFALVSRLTHTNIAKALVLHPAKETFYAAEDVRQKLRVLPGDTLMVMEYAPGVTLSQWRRQFPGGRVPVGQALEIARQIGSALDYAHGQKILHRDIKPANVMIETSGDGAVTARVLDFGLAAEIRSSMGRVSLEIRDTSGTRPYMAPEQWEGEKQVPATDQYALAVLFHELVTGEVPFASVFDTGDPAVMINVVGHKPFTPPPELPKSMRRALERALAKKPEERFASCGDFVAALSGKKASAKNEGAAAGRGGGAMKVFGVILLLAAVAGGGYFGWMKYDAKVKAREAELARMRQEAYELKGKASQAREKNAKEEWAAWPDFELKAKELEGFYRAGEAALEKDDYAAARVQFLKVRDNWHWLSSNKVMRAKAKMKADTEAALAAFRDNPPRWNDGFRLAQTADQDNSDIQFYLGVCYGLGYGGAAKDGAAAVQWYRKSAEQGDASAQFNLGVMYASGQGVSKDEAEAVRWYRKAAEKGYASAQFNLGWMYENGQGVTNDEAEAVRWYRKSAEQGHASAQFNLGLMYENGRGVSKDEAEAVRWYRKAAEQGDASAQCNLGWMYGNGRGVSKDEAEAVRWYRKSAEQGYASAQFNLGNRYGNGRGVSKDEAEAVRWYRKAAEQGNAGAQCNLGLMYENGRGVSKDEAEAARWYRKSAEQGRANGQYCLGDMYEYGKGVAKSIETAKMWYRKAAAQGHEKAKKSLERLGSLNGLKADKNKESGHPKTGDAKVLTLPGGATMEMIYVAPGTFTMGSPENEDGHESNETQHRVTLTKGYWLGRYEVTQKQWRSVMGGNPSSFLGDGNPVEGVSWEDCQRFIKKVNAQLNCGARLPTEAEWEYACRAGTTGAYGGTGSLDSMGWYNGNSGGTTTHPVGRKRVNAWGFHDMLGNVWEWCGDWYGVYAGDATDPRGLASGSNRVLRGGGWSSNARHCRAASRCGYGPGNRDSSVGFRLCCSALP